MSATKKADLVSLRATDPLAAKNVGAPTSSATGTRRLAAAIGDEAVVSSPAHALQARLAAQYQEPEAGEWPPTVRLRVILALAAAPWMVIGGAVFLLIKAT